VHCAVVALHVVQVAWSSATHVPAVFDIQYCVSPSIWLHSVHTLTPTPEEEHVAQSVVAPHAPLSVRQPGAAHVVQPEVSLVCPHVSQPCTYTSGIGHETMALSSIFQQPGATHVVQPEVSLVCPHVSQPGVRVPGVMHWPGSCQQ